VTTRVRTKSAGRRQLKKPALNQKNQVGHAGLSGGSARPHAHFKIEKKMEKWTRPGDLKSPFDGRSTGPGHFEKPYKESKKSNHGAVLRRARGLQLSSIASCGKANSVIVLRIKMAGRKSKDRSESVIFRRPGNQMKSHNTTLCAGAVGARAVPFENQNRYRTSFCIRRLYALLARFDAVRASSFATLTISVAGLYRCQKPV